MSQIKKYNFWATFISWFVTFTIGTAVGDYFELKGVVTAKRGFYTLRHIFPKNGKGRI